MEGVFRSWRWLHRFLHVSFCCVLLGSLAESQITFIIEPQDTDVVLGQPVTLNCSATFGSKRIKYSWTLDDTKIRPDSRVVVNKDGSLSITSAQKEDGGRYNCIARGRVSKRNVIETSQPATLTVQSICSAAKIVSTPSQSVFAAGNKIQLRCKCNVMPKVTVEWKKNGAPVVKNSQIVATGNRLNLQSPTVGDSGTYTCTAKNIIGERQSPAFKLSIIVTTNPVFQVVPNDTAALLGDSVTLHCSATGDPKPTIAWYFETETVPLSNSSKVSIMLDGSLQINNIAEDDFGKYKCVATNIKSSGVMEAEIRKAYIGKLKLEPQTRYVLSGQPFTYDCKVRGYPTPKIAWTRANGRPLPKRYDVMDGTALRNNKTRMADTESFTCTASNMAGQQSGNVKIVVSEPPVFTAQPKDTNAKETQKVVLECSARAVPPPIIQWRKDGVEIKPDKNHVIDSTGYLTIPKLSVNDQGMYSCTAQHLGGWSKVKTVNVTVMAIVKLGDYHQAHHKFDKGTKGKVYCSFTGHQPITIKWRKVGSKLAKKAVAQGDTLVIDDMEMSDAGMYACTGSNSFSNVTAYVNISVYVYPKFQLKPKNTTAMASDSVWLHCNASGYPKPKISWGKEKHGGDNLNKERFHQFENGTLHISNIQPDDEGRYYCIAGNLADFKQITISLKVVQTPPLAKKQTAASMGRTIGIAVGCAAAYIVLVVGLMIYCKGRRARQQKKEQLTMPVNGEIENDEEANNEMALQPINTTRTGYNKMEFPRHDLEALRTLGNGSYGRAFLARASGIKDGERDTMVVVKSLISKDDITREDFTREMEALVTMEHTNVVSLLGVCKDIEPLYMIFESLEKGDLKQFLLSCYDNGRSTLTSSHKLAMCSNIVSGMSYLAANKFVHKDLAARNCMVTKDLQVKIGFLGLSYDLYNAEYYRFNNILIPLRWMPSEAIFHDDFTEKSDVWSFGVLAWEIYMLGQTPYDDRSDEEVLKCVKDDLRLSKPDNCPDSVANVMNKCWEANPNDRPTFDMIFSEMAEVAVDSHV